MRLPNAASQRILQIVLLCIASSTTKTANAFVILPQVPDLLLHAPRLANTKPSPSCHYSTASDSNVNQEFQPVVQSPLPSLRRVAKVQQFARLPVWPVWMGILIFMTSRVLGKEVAAKLEDVCGGRVCPNFFPDTDLTSPFIMLVHHRHSFAPWDPIRWFQNRFILPEGFPAHPHRGFTTLTYFVKGGFRHRDSMGIVQEYGASLPHHSQWLFTGAGLLHEEMFLPQESQQELYQLWVNVPSQYKLDPPDVQLLGQEECPRVINPTSETVVLAGSYQDQSARTLIMSDMAIFHVHVEAGGSWSYPVPKSFETVVLYIRQGSCQVEDQVIPVHHTAYFERVGNLLQVSNPHAKQTADFLLLAGVPLREPVAAQGSMVMNTNAEIQKAYLDYQMGLMGSPWSHELDAVEYQKHVSQYPCRFRYTDDSSSST